MTKSIKLENFREKLIDMLGISYPDYAIGAYLNGIGRIPWLSVIDRSTKLRIAEVISVERFGPDDAAGNTLLVIDYINSNLTIFKNIDLALDNVKCILTTASVRKKECQVKAADERQEEGMVHLESLSGDKVTMGTIDPKQFYFYIGRRNGKTLFMQNLIKNLFGFKIKNVIFNEPATIVFWEDGGKTVVQCQNGEEFDPEKGLAMAISKKVYGNDYNYYDVFKKWVGKYNKKKFEKALEAAKKAAGDPDEVTINGVRYAKINTTGRAFTSEKAHDLLCKSVKDSMNNSSEVCLTEKQAEKILGITADDIDKEDGTGMVLKPYCDTSKEDDRE